jgi:hypothetical protein
MVRRRKKVRRARPGETNYAPVDAHTFVHAGFGALLGASGVPLSAALAASLVWELAEPDLKRRYANAFPSSTIDSAANKAADTAAVAAGWAMGKRSSRR